MLGTEGCMKFWERVEKTESCWLWTKARTKKGYGLLSVEGKLISAHRLSWMLAHGKLPKTKMVLHRCDVRHCVRPDHLFVGTAKENTDDMMCKGRQRSRSKFTVEQQQKLHDLWNAGGITQRELAEIFGVNQSTISNRLKAKTVRDEHGRLQCWEPKQPEKKAA